MSFARLVFVAALVCSAQRHEDQCDPQTPDSVDDASFLQSTASLETRKLGSRIGLPSGQSASVEPATSQHSVDASPSHELTKSGDLVQSPKETAKAQSKPPVMKETVMVQSKPPVKNVSKWVKSAGIVPVNDPDKVGLPAGAHGKNRSLDQINTPITVIAFVLFVICGILMLLFTNGCLNFESLCSSVPSKPPSEVSSTGAAGDNLAFGAASLLVSPRKGDKRSLEGKWVMFEASGNVDGYLQEMGASWMSRKLSAISGYGKGRHIMEFKVSGNRININESGSGDDAAYVWMVGGGWQHFIGQTGPTMVEPFWDVDGRSITANRKDGSVGSTKGAFPFTTTMKLISSEEFVKGYISPSGQHAEFHYKRLARI